MTIEAQYARALYLLVSQNPERSGEYLAGMRAMLEKKGHQKLMPRIFGAYRSHIEKNERTTTYAQISPERERTRVLLELYRTLIR